MNGYHLKAYTRDQLNISHFAKTYGIGRGNTFFFTLTFKNNIINKKEASLMWNNLLSQIKKHFTLFRFIMVSERQKRGAWHFHLLCSAHIPSLNKFIRRVENFIRISTFGYGFVNAKWTSGNDYKGISKYLTKYLTKTKREKGIRYVSYSNNWQRLARLPFAWVGGKSATWRARCRSLSEHFGQFFNIFYESSNYHDKMNVITEDDFEISKIKIHSWFKSQTSDSLFQIFNTQINNIHYQIQKIVTPYFVGRFKYSNITYQRQGIQL